MTSWGPTSTPCPSTTATRSSTPSPTSAPSLCCTAGRTPRSTSARRTSTARTRSTRSARATWPTPPPRWGRTWSTCPPTTSSTGPAPVPTASGTRCARRRSTACRNWRGSASAVPARRSCGRRGCAARTARTSCGPPCGWPEGDGELRFVDDQQGSPTFTADLAPTIVTLGLDRRPGIFHATNGGVTTWRGLVQEVLALAGGDPERVQADQDVGAQRPRPASGLLGARQHGAAPQRAAGAASVAGEPGPARPVRAGGARGRAR